VEKGRSLRNICGSVAGFEKKKVYAKLLRFEFYLDSMAL